MPYKLILLPILILIPKITSPTLINFLTKSDCLIYLTFSEEMNTWHHRLLMAQQPLNVQDFFGYLPYLQSDLQIPFIIHQQSSCFQKLHGQRVAFYENLIPVDKEGYCIVFLIFQRRIEQIKSVIQTYSTFSADKAWYIVFSRVEFPREDPEWSKYRHHENTNIFTALRKFKAVVLFAVKELKIWNSFGKKEANEGVFMFDYFLLCYFCSFYDKLQPILKENLTFEYIARRFAEVNQNQGHNHLAVVDRSYH
ncbi:unnamed protein product, partial [Allacma fusca]